MLYSKVSTWLKSLFNPRLQNLKFIMDIDKKKNYLESQEQNVDVLEEKVETSKFKYFSVKYILMGGCFLVLLLASIFVFIFLSSSKTVNVSAVNPSKKPSSFQIYQEKRSSRRGRNNKTDRSPENSKTKTNKSVEHDGNAKDVDSGATNNSGKNAASSGSVAGETTVLENSAGEDDTEESNTTSTPTLTTYTDNLNQNLLIENGNILFSHPKTSGSKNNFEIFSYDPELKQLKSLVEDLKIKPSARKMSAPIISPDGKIILFILNQYKICAKSIDKPDSDAYIVYESNIRINDFCFGPTGDEIIFIGFDFRVSNYTDENFRKIYEIKKQKNSNSLKYDNRKEITNLTHDTGTEMEKVKLTPDGRYLVFITLTESNNQLTLNLIPYLDGDNKKISIPATDDKIIKKINLSSGTLKDFFSIYPSDESKTKIKFLFYESDNSGADFKTIIYTIELDLNDLSSDNGNGITGADLSNKKEIHKSKDQIKSPILSPDEKFIVYSASSSVLKLLNLEDNSIVDLNLNLIDKNNKSFIGNPIVWTHK